MLLHRFLHSLLSMPDPPTVLGTPGCIHPRLSASSTFHHARLHPRYRPTPTHDSNDWLWLGNPVEAPLRITFRFIGGMRSPSSRVTVGCVVCPHPNLHGVTTPRSANTHNADVPSTVPTTVALTALPPQLVVTRILKRLPKLSNSGRLPGRAGAFLETLRGIY